MKDETSTRDGLRSTPDITLLDPDDQRRVFVSRLAQWIVDVALTTDREDPIDKTAAVEH